ncbi:MAG TPA: cell division ATP-binding protein FtsE [Firmicutes bacterium]|nr:cell division ATP-binding protein FtsE [Bacillota bacterium]
MISLLDVSKRYKNGHLALDNVSMEIEAGEFVFLCGQSGAGKSTLIRLLFREEVATSGQLIVNNRNLMRIKRRDLLKHRREMGIVFQDYRLLPKKNVFDNVAYAMQVTESRKREIARRVPEVLELVGLSDKGENFPSQLSGGEQQRVAIARALVNRPAILVADEPTGNLDPQNSDELMEVLIRINDRGTTVVMATHAKDIVNAMKKRVIMLDHGKVVYDEKEGGYHEAPLL